MIDEDLIPITISDRNGSPKLRSDSAVLNSVLKPVAHAVRRYKRSDQVPIDNTIVIVADENHSRTVRSMPAPATVLCGSATRVEWRSIGLIVAQFDFTFVRQHNTEFG